MELAREGKVERDPPLSEGTRQGVTYRWRAAGPGAGPSDGPSNLTSNEGGYMVGGEVRERAQEASPDAQKNPRIAQGPEEGVLPAETGAQNFTSDEGGYKVGSKVGSSPRICPRCGADADVLPGGKRGHCPTCLKVFPISDEEEAPMLEEMPEEAPLTGAKPDPPVPSCRICNAPGDFVVEGEDAWVCASHSKT